MRDNSSAIAKLGRLLEQQSAKWVETFGERLRRDGICVGIRMAIDILCEPGGEPPPPPPVTKWLDRPPTADEVKAHAAAHTVIGSGRELNWGRWMRTDEILGPVIRKLAVNHDGNVVMIGAYGAYGNVAGGRWAPLTADGSHIEAPDGT